MVVTSSGSSETKRLAAYVAPRPGCRIEAGELREFLRTRLPGYMIPSNLTVLAALPLGPNGKVDRKALPSSDAQAPLASAPQVQPRNAVEELMAGIWREVLGLPQIGVQDNFFDLGGHSLLAMQIVSRLRSTLQVELPLRRLFETPTVAGLAAGLLESPEERARLLHTAALVLQIAGLSDEEVERLLAAQGPA